MNKSWKRMIGVLCFCGVMGSMSVTAYADNFEGIQLVETKEESSGADYVEADQAAGATAAIVISAFDAGSAAGGSLGGGQATSEAVSAGQASEADELEEEEAAAADFGTQTEADNVSNQGTSDIRQQVVNYALSFVGGPYRYGGNDPRTGVDCSGFTRFVLSNAAGIQMARSSGSQASQGVAISADQMKPGDLLFYGGKRGINHVAMYIGSGKIVHASTYKTGIKVSNWNYRNPVRIVNVLG